MNPGVKAAKGGRGNKGGLREAARQAGVPSSTAHDAVKLSGNTNHRTVSAPKPNGHDSAPGDEARRAAADRARRCRSRRGAGLVFLGWWMDKRRLKAALRAAEDRLGNDETTAALRAAAAQVLEDFVTRWVGKK